MTPPVDALTVPCPDCQAPAGEPCRMSGSWPAGSVHAPRNDSARLSTVTHGTCLLCGRPAVKGQRAADGPVIAWHPDPAHHDCPPMPDPGTDWNAYATAVNLGVEPGIIDAATDFLTPTTAPYPSACLTDPTHGGYLTDSTGMLYCAVCRGGCETNYDQPPSACDHQWLDRPESDTQECLLCGHEANGGTP